MSRAIAIGDTFGRYEILGSLGRGGMGEVYRARDRDLDREVALKFLPPSLVDEQESLDRLRQEARMLATFSHPNIASIYGLEHHDGMGCLAMELVPGKTLADVLKDGPLPEQECLRLGRQIAAALRAAHEHGVIHRDLKPANVMITPEGTAKLLDFGLARLSAPSSTERYDPDAPTHGVEITAREAVAGTLAYMSPEQLRGQHVDSRTDIWAFGCVLYEMLTGARAFSGDTQAEVAAAVLNRNVDWSLLRTRPEIERLVHLCLRTDPDRRLRDIGDAGLLTRSYAEPVARGTPSDLRRWPPAAWIALAATATALVGWAAWLWVQGGPEARTGPMRFEVNLENGAELALGTDYPPAVAVAPVTGRFAYVVEDPDGVRRIAIRGIDQPRSTTLPGTEGARAPFFSPDGEWVGFFANRKLEKVAVSGGAPVEVGDVAIGISGAWGPKDRIVFADSYSSGLKVVSATGGEIRPLTRVRVDQGEQGHESPAFIPGRDAVVFTVWRGGSFSDADIAVQRLDAQEHTILLRGGSHPRITPSGYLTYGRGSALLAAPLDLGSLQTKRAPFEVLDGVLTTLDGSPIYDLSHDGFLIYAPAQAETPPGRMLLVDRDGQAEALEQGTLFGRPRISPDGTRIAYHALGQSYDVWVRDLDTGVRSRITAHGGWDGFPIWGPDSRRVVFSSIRHGPMNLYLSEVGSATEPTPLLPPGNPRWATSWASDGSAIAYFEEHVDTGFDIWLLPMTDDPEPVPFLATPFDESWPRFSPDGRWLAYDSDENTSTGEDRRFEIYVQGVEGRGQRLQVSADGGIVPIWSRDGGEIYYVHDGTVMAVPVQLGPRPRAGTPRALFSSAGMEINDLGPDDDFLAVQDPILQPVRTVHVVLGWPELIRRTRPDG